LKTDWTELLMYSLSLQLTERKWLSVDRGFTLSRFVETVC